jgi:AcrR family transcriptional regulator
MTKGEQTRAAILGQALERASVVGLEGLSIGALAQRTGLTKSGLFAHFGSKEALQVEVLRAAARRFAELVIRSARRETTALNRLRALFENWLDWTDAGGIPGGCIFLAAAVELDDKDGPARDYLVEVQTNWLKTLALAAHRAAREGALAPDIDGERFAHDLHGIYLSYHQAKRLLRDPDARRRALDAFETLIANNR